MWIGYCDLGELLFVFLGMKNSVLCGGMIFKTYEVVNHEISWGLQLLSNSFLNKNILDTQITMPRKMLTVI
jgi:hypothetical protein